MKKAFLFLLLLTPLFTVGQQTYFTPGVPPSSTSFTPTFRFLGTDSLAKYYLNNSNRWSQVYTAAQVNALLASFSGLPSQTGNSGKFLTTNGTVASWATVSSNNIYTADGKLTGSRLVDVNGHDIFIGDSLQSSGVQVAQTGGSGLNVSLNSSDGSTYQSVVAAGNVASGGTYMNFNDLTNSQQLSFDGTSMSFMDQINHIGPVAHSSIDTANMTSHPKAYVTSEWVTHHVSGGGAAWGSITGTLSDQTDLQTALDAKSPILTFGQGLANDGSGNISLSSTNNITSSTYLTVTGLNDLTFRALGSTSNIYNGILGTDAEMLGSNPATGASASLHANGSGLFIFNQSTTSSGGKVQSFTFNPGVSPVWTSAVLNLPIKYGGDYSTNIRLQPYAFTSTKVVIALADSVKGTISAGGITALTGDVTASGSGSVAATLATVNSNTGSFGDATHVGAFTVNGKGLITAASSTAIQIAESQVTSLTSDLALKSPLASPTFTGTPAAPTATGGTNTTQIATTAFVQSAVSGVSVPTAANPSGLLTFTVANGSNTTYLRNDALHAIDSTVVRSVANSRTLAQEQTALNLKANIASPTFTGTVTIPNGSVLGTPTSLTLTNATGLPNAGLTNSSLTVNGTSIALGASGTVTAAAGTLTGSTLNSTVTASSLTSVGTLSAGSIPYSLVTGGPSSLTAGRGILIPSTAIILDTTQNYNWLKGQTVTKNGIATTTTNAWNALNTTLSTSGATRQFSPAFHWQSHVWNTTSVAADNFSDWTIDDEPTSSSSPQGVLTWKSYIGTTALASPATEMTLTRSSGLSVTSGITSGTTVQGATVQSTGKVQAATQFLSNGTGNTAGLYMNGSVDYFTVTSLTNDGLLGFTAGAVGSAPTVVMKWSNNSTISLVTAPPTSASTYDFLTRNTSTGVVEKIASASIPTTQATADLTAQSAAGNVTTFTVGSSTATFNISTYINVTAVSVDVIQGQITYTDENNTSQTVSLANISAIGNSTYSPITIRAKNATVITVKTNLTTGAGSIVFDCGGRITQL